MREKTKLDAAVVTAGVLVLALAAGLVLIATGALSDAGKPLSPEEAMGAAVLPCVGLVALVWQWRYGGARGAGVGVPPWSSSDGVFAAAVGTGVSVNIFLPAILISLAFAAGFGDGLFADGKLADGVVFPLTALSQFVALAAMFMVLWAMGAARELRFGAGWRSLPASLFWGVWSVPVCLASALALTALLTTDVIAFGEWLRETFGVSLGLDVKQETVEIFGRHAGEPLFMAMAVVAACVAAPLAEETFFRGILYPFFKSKGGVWLAAGATGLLFGLVHFNAQAFLPLAALGAYLCIVYEKTGDLRVPIATHALFNGASLLSLCVEAR
ncbi:MAG: CPBP family intramembrane metalloprotease [Puniceicoccales bacterium]|jgi:membrane protease YdiL (CAAX protease family)|nr:CPBP family intramembrane metalloprotease [Puniceicoccales bacterium]